MNSKHLMEAIGEMNEKYIEQYADIKAKKVVERRFYFEQFVIRKVVH